MTMNKDRENHLRTFDKNAIDTIRGFLDDGYEINTVVDADEYAYGHYDNRRIIGKLSDKLRSEKRDYKFLPLPRSNKLLFLVRRAPKNEIEENPGDEYR